MYSNVMYFMYFRTNCFNCVWITIKNSEEKWLNESAHQLSWWRPWRNLNNKGFVFQSISKEQGFWFLTLNRISDITHHSARSQVEYRWSFKYPQCSFPSVVSASGHLFFYSLWLCPLVLFADELVIHIDCCDLTCFIASSNIHLSLVLEEVQILCLS